MITAEVTFLAPASKAFVPAQVLAGCDYDSATPVDYVADRDLHRPADQRGHYRVDRGHHDRHRSPQEQRTRPTPCGGCSCTPPPAPAPRPPPGPRNSTAPATTSSRLTRGLGSRHYPTVEAVTARITTIARERRVGDYLRTTIGTDHNGRPTLDWHFDQAALDAETATDGWYALLTNLPDSITAAQVLARYKNQPGASERRYHDFKGPLAVAPMFLHTNRRIAALIGVVCLALLIYCLVEREARRNLAPPQTRRPLRRPTRQTHRRPDLQRPRLPATANQHRRHTRDPPARHPPEPPPRPTQDRPETHTMTPTHRIPCANYGASRVGGVAA